ncbi:MAG: hypothetical protein AB1779_04440 [Candidatus Thermoplasmatota archaeon]
MGVPIIKIVRKCKLCSEDAIGQCIHCRANYCEKCSVLSGEGKICKECDQAKKDAYEAIEIGTIVYKTNLEKFERGFDIEKVLWELETLCKKLIISKSMLIAQNIKVDVLEKIDDLLKNVNTKICEIFCKKNNYDLIVLKRMYTGREQYMKAWENYEKGVRKYDDAIDKKDFKRKDEIIDIFERAYINFYLTRYELEKAKYFIASEIMGGVLEDIDTRILNILKLSRWEKKNINLYLEARKNYRWAWKYLMEIYQCFDYRFNLISADEKRSIDFIIETYEWAHHCLFATRLNIVGIKYSPPSLTEWVKKMIEYCNEELARILKKYKGYSPIKIDLFDVSRKCYDKVWDGYIKTMVGDWTPEDALLEYTNLHYLLCVVRSTLEAIGYCSISGRHIDGMFVNLLKMIDKQITDLFMSETATLQFMSQEKINERAEFVDRITPVFAENNGKMLAHIDTLEKYGLPEFKIHKDVGKDYLDAWENFAIGVVYSRFDVETAKEKFSMMVEKCNKIRDYWFVNVHSSHELYLDCLLSNATICLERLKEILPPIEVIVEEIPPLLEEFTSMGYSRFMEPKEHSILFFSLSNSFCDIISSGLKNTNASYFIQKTQTLDFISNAQHFSQLVSTCFLEKLKTDEKKPTFVIVLKEGEFNEASPTLILEDIRLFSSSKIVREELENFPEWLNFIFLDPNFLVGAIEKELGGDCQIFIDNDTFNNDPQSFYVFVDCLNFLKKKKRKIYLVSMTANKKFIGNNGHIAITNALNKIAGSIAG